MKPGWAVKRSIRASLRGKSRDRLRILREQMGVKPGDALDAALELVTDEQIARKYDQITAEEAEYERFRRKPVRPGARDGADDHPQAGDER